MAADPTDGTLSTRGSYAAAPGRGQQLFDIIRNLWDPQTNPNGYVSLGVAENALMHKEMAAYIEETFKMPELALTYGEGASGGKRLAAAISRFLNRYFKPASSILPQHVNVSNGVTSSVEHLAWTLGDAGDGFLLGRPYYGSFPHDLGNRAGIKTIEVKFGPDTDPMSLAAVAKYEETLLYAQVSGIKIRALVLSSPHNPLGLCYSRNVLVAYMGLCQKYRLHLISDEIYALSVFANPRFPDATPFTSVLSIDPTGILDRELIHVLWGMSKDFGSNGLRIGCIVSQDNPALMRALLSNSLFSFPSSVAEDIVSRILEDDEFTGNYIKTNRQRMAESYAFTTEFLEKLHVPYYPGANAAFFVWCNLGAVWRKKRLDVAKLSVKDNDELVNREVDITTEIMERLLEQKIFLASGAVFGSEEPGWFRIVFTQPRQMLEEGLVRIMRAIES